MTRRKQRLVEYFYTTHPVRVEKERERERKRKKKRRAIVILSFFFFVHSFPYSPFELWLWPLEMHRCVGRYNGKSKRKMETHTFKGPSHTVSFVDW